MKTALFLLFASPMLWAQPYGAARPAATPSAAKSAGQSTQSAGQAATQSANQVQPDAALTQLLSQVQSMAAQSDSDLAVLRIEKWKGEPGSKQQNQATVASIRRNLDNAVPELLQRLQAAPGSLSANFRLYRNLNALYDTFSALAESAGAFGPAEQYTPLAEDLAQLDKVRHSFAERMDQLSDLRDAELLRLRTQSAASAAKPASKIVVDDNQPVKKKPKNPPATSSQQ